MQSNRQNEERILVLAPRGRDAQVIEQVLARDGFSCTVCGGHQALLRQLDIGAGAALIAEEALLGADLTRLAAWLSHQASWSDFPFILLVTKQTGQATHGARNLLESLSNVILLERPLNAETLRRATASALRARKRQYQARRDLHDRIRSEERLLIALQAGRLGSWELDLTDWSLTASERCKANFGRAVTAPFSFDDLLASTHPDDRARLRIEINTAISALSNFDIEYRVLWPDGTLHWVQLQGKTSCNAEGAPIMMVGVTLDVTDRREAERRLRESQDALLNLNETLESRIESRTAELAQANDRLMREMAERERAQMALVQTQKMEAIGRLTGGIAHDFNNLLSVIQGNVELIDLLSTDERVKRMAVTARKASERGAKLTGQLLAFSRSQTLDLKAVDLNETMEGVKELLSASLGSDIQVHYELAAGMPRVKADVNQIELAILNLAINARDAMPDGGILRIRTALRIAPPDLVPEGRYAVVSVIDHGQGINAEIISKVFDPFFTTKAHGKGTGLGLSQVYGIAQQTGGTARIESVVGTGTTVEIWLPLAEASDAAEFPHDSRNEDRSESNRAKVLVVEDDPAVRHFMVECLEILGYQVVQANHGQAGLEQLEADRPDLLIADFLMPGMTGAELVEKASRKFPDLPVIIATGYADMHAIDQVIGANTVLRKPFQINELASCVRRALKQSKSVEPNVVGGSKQPV
ncbi:MAG: hybrid sensor histidine kinase/response regulator [Herminiimonas sp.]|nr:hybrid sensor histidine kinase/response regulator [Herminiimonas sp.]